MMVLPAVFTAGLMAATVVGSVTAQESAPTGSLAHTRTQFKFTVNASFERAMPLFGADEERKWAPGWNPKFVYPVPAHDQPGMVFLIAHGQMTSTWVNTAFDLAGGHVQYVYVMGDAMATMIDIHLTREGPEKTAVDVVYERSALAAEANQHVEHFAEGDRKAKEEWEGQINGYLARNLRESKQK